MTTKKIESKNKKKSEWSKTFELIGWSCLTGVYQIIEQIVLGAKNRTLPAHFFLLWIVPVGAVLFFRLDQLLISFTRFAWLYPIHPLFYWPYAFIFLYAPYIVWGGVHAWQYQKYRRAISIAFQDAGLVTGLGRMPKFITDVPLDDSVREMTFDMNGTPLSEFEKAKERLTEVFGNIEDIKITSMGTVAIQYSHNELPKNTEIFDVPSASEPGMFAIGYTRSGLVTANLTQVPHLLIAGMTNSGKSTFVRQFIVTLLAYNSNLVVYFVDLKFELEANTFKNVKRLKPISHVPNVITLLHEMEGKIKSRAEFLTLNDCTSIEKLGEIRRPLQWTKEITSLEQIGRIVIVIDEATELFLAGGSTTLNQAKEAKRFAIGIAAKGRAVGIHMVVATQRPDKQAVDMQLKTNLLGRLCFHMTDNASSMTILDSVRAAHLPNQPGRAIWRQGGKQQEVQTLHLSEESLTQVLKTRNLLVEPKELTNGPANSNETEKAAVPVTALNASDSSGLRAET